MDGLKHILNTNKSKVRLTKSPKPFVIIIFGLSLLLLTVISLVVWLSVGSLVLKLVALLISVSSLWFIGNRLLKLSEAFFLTDMLIVEPLLGKNIITPVQGVVIKKSLISNIFPICKVHIRLDGKKSVHFFYGKCEELMREKLKIEDFLIELKKNKKVNHKPGSVSSVA